MESSIKYEKNGMIYEDILQPYSEEQQQEAEINRENASLVFSPKFILVYPELLKNGCTLTEALLYGFIDYYKLSPGKKFYFTNEQLGEIICCSPDTVSRAMSSLEKRGLIKTSKKMKFGGGLIRYVTDISSISKSTNCQFGNRQNLQTNKNYIKEKNIYISTTTEKPSKAKPDTSTIDILKDPDVLFAIAKTHHVLEDDVRDLALQLRLYCESKGKRYKNYVAALRVWVLKEKKAGKLEEVTIV